MTTDLGTSCGMDSLTQVDDEDIQVFLIEGQDILNGMEQSILSFETTASIDPQQFNQLYRGLHTLKGNCGFLPFPKLEAIAHSGETLLDTLRSTQQNFTSDIATTLLQTIDSIRNIFQTIQATGQEGTDDYSALVARLTALSQPSTLVETQEKKLAPLETQFLNTEPLATSESTIRVSIDLLDRLMNLVGELVLARNRMLQLLAINRDSTLVATTQHINFVTNELQDSVMRSRLQPIGTLWRSLPRMVRDLSLACGKSVRLELEGEDTELDRSIIAALKDPLTHLIRNCIDHGIEPPEMRTATGKPACGVLKIRAVQGSGKIKLELHDDGRGIDPAQLKLRSGQLGLISNVQADAMSDREAFDLMFLPGFSTAAEVTRLSGRGVGLDVVRRNIEAVNGTVSVESELGKGTTFCLRIPLTLAIVSALLISSGNERFAIPQASIQELVRIEGVDAIERSIEYLLGAPVYRLRGQILPLVYLNQVLALPTAQETALLHIVVINVDGYRFGLIVDAIEDTQEIVVKPLSKQLRSLTMFAGATILGDGTVSLILDAIGLAQQADVNAQPTVLDTTEQTYDNRQLVLLVQAAQGSPLGILMNRATRLETIPISQIERVGDRYLMQYRDRIVALIDLSALLSNTPRSLDRLNAELNDPLSIVVITLDDERTVGLVVDAIVDIVEESLGVTSAANRPGVQYYTTVKGQITEILDLMEIVELANPHRAAREMVLRR